MSELSAASTQARLTATDPADYITDWADQFLLAKRAEGRSPATIVFYRQQLGHFLAYCEAQVLSRISELTPANLRAFLLWLAETGHNPGGVHAAYRIVKAYLRWYEYEVDPPDWRNPIRRVKPPRVSLEPLEPAGLDIVQALLDTCAPDILGARDRALLLALLDTGARARELLAFSRTDCNPTTGAVLVRHGKGDKPRTVFLGRRARSALRAYLKLRRDDHPALWLAETGVPLGYSGLRGMVQRRAKTAGVAAPTLHAFRRAFALNMLRAGVDVITLARLMGHASLTVLQRYLKQMPDDLQAAHALGSPADQLGRRRR
jgi:integrase/recombinase XerD